MPREGPPRSDGAGRAAECSRRAAASPGSSRGTRTVTECVELPAPFHGVTLGLPVGNRVRVELDAYRLRIHAAAQVHLDGDTLLGAVGLHAQGAEARLRPVRGERLSPGDQFCAQFAALGRSGPVRGRRRHVVLLRVLADDPVGRESRREPRHTRAHLRDPASGQTLLVPRVEAGDHVALQQRIERLGLSDVPGGIVAMVLAVPERPPHLGRIGFGPPAVELREVQAAVDEHFHSAGSARLPRASRRVDPQVAALHEPLRQEQIVVGEEDHAPAHLGTTHELDPGLDHLLTGLIGGMRLPRHDELNRTVAIGQDPDQSVPVVEQHARTFVGGESPREAERERVRVQAPAHRRGLVRLHGQGGDLRRHALAGIAHEALPGAGAHGP